MDKRKIKTPGVLRKEADELLALVKDEEIWAETASEKNEFAKALSLDIQRLPDVSFSYKQLYAILRFLVTLNQGNMEMANYVRDEDEEFLCDVLSAGIIYELDEYVASYMVHALNGIEITIKGVGTDDVQR